MSTTVAVHSHLWTCDEVPGSTESAKTRKVKLLKTHFISTKYLPFTSIIQLYIWNLVACKQGSVNI